MSESLHDQRKASAMTLRSYDATYDVFKGYDLTILENLYNAPFTFGLRSS